MSQFNEKRTDTPFLETTLFFVQVSQNPLGENIGNTDRPTQHLTLPITPETFFSSK
jgi:hypothetical protein